MSSTRCLHVVGARAQLVEARRVHAVFLGRPAGDRVEADVRDVEVEELPHVGAVGAVLDARRDVLVLRGQVVLEHVGRLDDVVVDADEDHVFDAHARQLTRVDMRADTRRQVRSRRKARCSGGCAWSGSGCRTVR